MFRTIIRFVVAIALISGATLSDAQRIRSESELDDWWAERAAVPYPRYEFTLASTNFAPVEQTNLSLSRVVPSAPNAILADGTWTGATSGAWLTATNWSSSVIPGSKTVTTNTDIANIASGTSNAGNIGINMNTQAGNEYLGAFSITGASTTAVQVSDSSATAGILNLNGATVNSVANVIIRNASAALFTISTNGAGTMGVALGNTTNNIINIDSTGGVTISSIISGSGRDLTRAGAGAGILTLSGANTFSGTFTASTGTTNLSVNNALGGVGAVSIASGATLITSVTGLTNAINDSAAVTVNGTLDTSGGTETVASLAGTSTGAFLTIGKSGAASGSFTVGDSTNTSFAGVIRDGTAGAGTTTFTKQGAGTLTLTGASTYTGTTNVNAGTLLVNNTSGSGTGTSTVTVNNSGTILGGTGTISGAVTINQNASMTGGTNGGVGTLTLSSGATFTGASSNLATYINDISGATADKLVITGALNLTNAFDRILFNGTADGTTTYVLATYTSVSGTFDTVANLPAGYQLIYGATELDLTPVPEPSTWIAGALALIVIGYSSRKRFVR